MGLEQVIEDDMVEFLDLETPKEEVMLPERTEEMVTAKHDWLSETRDYLKRNRQDEAKKVFEDLKQRYHETPETHPEERKRLYGVLQQCYIEIFNSINDRNRTAILLKRLEQSPDAVFDLSVKPVDLQHVERVDQVQLPEFEPLTRQTLQQISAPAEKPKAEPSKPIQKQEHKPIPSFDLSLPVPPPGVAVPMQLLSQQAALQVPVVNQPVQAPEAPKPVAASVKESDDARQLREQISILLRRASMIAATSPERSKALLKEVRDKLVMFSPEDSKYINEKLELIEESSKAHQARISFTKKFNDEYVHVVSLCRLKNENAIPTFTRLYRQAAGFEHEFPMYQAMFTNRLSDIQKEFFLYDDGELSELLKPYLLKLKRTSGTEQKMAMEELQHFIKTMPPSYQRDRLHTLAQKAFSTQATPALRTEAHPDPEERQQLPIRHFARRLTQAASRKDTNSFVSILEEFTRYASKQSPDVRDQILEAIAQLRNKVRPADEAAILNLVRPYLRRVALARANHDGVELGLALESFNTFVRSLPESEEKAVLENALAHVGGS